MCLFTYKVIYKEVSPQAYKELSLGIGGIKITDDEVRFCSSKEVGAKLKNMPLAKMGFLEPYENILEDGIVFKGIETKFGYFELLENNTIKIYIRRKREAWKKN